MGACQSSEDVEVVEEVYEEGEGFDEFTARRSTVNKKTEAVEEHMSDVSRPENDFFEIDEEVVEETKEFLAVKPWIGQIAEPDSHPEWDASPPDQSYQLEYVYGYRCQDSRQNVYFNPDGNIVYSTAAIGVILDTANNTQTFFGGGESENQSKQVSNTRNSHNNDITALNVNASDRQWAVSGQVGKNPSIFVWNTQTGEKRARF